MYLITPVADDEEATAEETIRSLLDQGLYVIKPSCSGRTRINAGDRICFYRTRIGVVAEAVISAPPQKKSVKFARFQGTYSFAVPVEKVTYFFDKPIVLDEKTRRRLDIFRSRNVVSNWAWFVLTTRVISKQDYFILTGRA